MADSKEPETVYEDENLVVINKPAGMVVNDAKTVHGETVQAWFFRNYGLEPGSENDTEFMQKGGVVHRLDKETSGLLVLARNAGAYEKLKLQFLERKTVKKYIALVHGTLKPEKGIISLPIERHPKAWGKFAIGTDPSRTAITEWSTREIFKDYSLVDLLPMTGRTHQLRVHLKHLGHPIISDPLYAGDKTLRADLAVCPRMFLHAWSLTLSLPDRGEIKTWEIGLPPDLEQTLKKLVH